MSYQNKIIAQAECPGCGSIVTEIDANTGLCEPCFKEYLLNVQKEDRAMFADSLPVSALPFLNRMREILVENDTNNPNGLNDAEKAKFRANLWIILYQTYGQLFNVDHYDEFKELSEILE